MAFAVSGGWGTNTGRTAVATTPTSNEEPLPSALILHAFGSQNVGHSTTPSASAPTGGGLSWTKIAETSAAPWNGNAARTMRGSMWWARSSAGAQDNFPLALDNYPGSEVGVYAARTIQVLDARPVLPIVQVATAAATAGGGDGVTGSVTFDEQPTAGNLIACWWMAGADNGGAFGAPTAGPGKTFVATGNEWNDYTQTAGFYRVADGFESNVITQPGLGGAVGQWIAVAVEVAHSSVSVAPSGSVTLRMG